MRTTGLELLRMQQNYAEDGQVLRAVRSQTLLEMRQMSRDAADFSALLLIL